MRSNGIWDMGRWVGRSGVVVLMTVVGQLVGSMEQINPDADDGRAQRMVRTAEVNVTRGGELSYSSFRKLILEQGNNQNVLCSA